MQYRLVLKMHFQSIIKHYISRCFSSSTNEIIKICQDDEGIIKLGTFYNVSGKSRNSMCFIQGHGGLLLSLFSCSLRMASESTTPG